MPHPSIEGAFGEALLTALFQLHSFIPVLLNSCEVSRNTLETAHATDLVVRRKIEVWDTLRVLTPDEKPILSFDDSHNLSECTVVEACNPAESG